MANHSVPKAELTFCGAVTEKALLEIHEGAKYPTHH